MNESVLDSRLRDGLRRLPFPATDTDFDERVLRALRSPPPWYAALWRAIQPAAVSAFGSMFVMLGVIWLTTGHVVIDPTPAPSSSANMCAIDWNIVERVLNRPVVTAASLQECVRTARIPAPEPPAIPRRPIGVNHASRPQYMA